MSPRHRQIIKQDISWPILGSLEILHWALHALTFPLSLPNPSHCFLYLFKKQTFIYLAVPGLSCGRWDLAPGPGREARPPALGTQRLGHLTSREAPPFSLWLERPPGFPCIFTQAGTFPLLNHAVPRVSCSQPPPFLQGSPHASLFFDSFACVFRLCLSQASRGPSGGEPAPFTFSPLL